MKQLSLALVAAILFLTSCSEDFDVTAPYRDITVVYGILNMEDTAHYVRIQKAFLDESKSAINMATEPDSSFYNNLDVVVKKINVQSNQVEETYILNRVNLNNEGYPKQPGAFFTSPNYAYKFKAPLSAFFIYRLVVTNSLTGAVDSAETGVVNADTNKKQNNFYIGAFSEALYTLEFTRTGPAYTYSLYGTVPKNAKFFEGFFRFHYKDSNIVNGNTENKSFEWNFDTDVLVNQSTDFTLEVPNSSIYGILRDNMGLPTSQNIVRRINGVDIYVYAGDTTLFRYQQIVLNSGGITGDQIKPTYTNIRGSGRAVGLFASRTFRVRYNVPVDKETINALQSNELTQPLNIIDP